MDKQGQYLTPKARRLLQKSLQSDLPKQYRQRIEIMLLADSGKSQAQICQALGCSQGTARYWITLARAGEAHNWNAFPIGRPKTVNEQYLSSGKPHFLKQKINVAIANLNPQLFSQVLA